MWLGVLVIYVAGVRVGVAMGVMTLPAWTTVPGKVFRAGWCWVRVSVEMWGYRGSRRPRKGSSYRGRHHVRRFERSYTARDKRKAGFRQPVKRTQTGV